MVFEHVVEDENQLAHASCKGHLLGFSRSTKTLAKALIMGLCLVAVTEAIYRAARTSARPPQTVRLPRIVPLSRLRGNGRCAGLCSRRLLAIVEPRHMEPPRRGPCPTRAPRPSRRSLRLSILGVGSLEPARPPQGYPRTGNGRTAHMSSRC